MALVKGFRLPEDNLIAPRVVIAMPAYNAERTLARTVADIPAGIADQLILVDDASPDNTVQLARALGIEVHVHPENRGYGGNQKTCYSTALTDDADIVVMLHPDYQYEPRAVPLLIAPILAGDADMTFGSRFAGLSDPRSGGMPIERYFGNRITTLFENLILGSRFSEMHSGMRAYTRRCLLSLPFRRYSNDFVFDSQLLIDAVTTGQRVIEVPIPTRYTHESSSIGMRSSLSYVAGSLGYCAHRVWRHGRRRHRAPQGRRYARSYTGPATPVGWPDCSLCGRPQPHVAYSKSAYLECQACGLVTSQEAPAGALTHSDILSDSGSVVLEWVLTTMGGYHVSGNRLLAVGAPSVGWHELATSTAWNPVDPAAAGRAAQSEPDRVDALLFAAIDHAVDFGGLHGLRSIVHPEGLLALVVPCLRRSRPDRSYRHQVRPESLDRALGDAGFRLVEWARLPRVHARSYRRWCTSANRPVVATERSDIALAVARRADPAD